MRVPLIALLLLAVGFPAQGAGRTRQQGPNPNGPIVVLISSERECYTGVVEAFEASLKRSAIRTPVRTFHLNGLRSWDPDAKQTLARARALKPSLLVCVGQNALLLGCSEKVIPVLFSSVPFYMSDAILSQQNAKPPKKKQFLNFSGVSWGDKECAKEAMHAVPVIVPGRLRVGVLYSKLNLGMVQAIKAEARNMNMGFTIFPYKMEREKDTTAAIKYLVGEKKVNACILPIRDMVVSKAAVRNKVIKIMSGNHNIPVISMFPDDLETGAAAVISIDSKHDGKRVSALYQDLLKSPKKAPLIRSGADARFYRRFNLTAAKTLKGVRKPDGKGWEFVK